MLNVTVLTIDHQKRRKEEAARVAAEQAREAARLQAEQRRYGGASLNCCCCIVWHHDDHYGPRVFVSVHFRCRAEAEERRLAALNDPRMQAVLNEPLDPFLAEIGGVLDD